MESPLGKLIGILAVMISGHDVPEEIKLMNMIGRLFVIRLSYSVSIKTPPIRLLPEEKKPPELKALNYYSNAIFKTD